VTTRRRAFVSACSALLLLAACGERGPGLDRYLRGNVEASEIVGVWRPTSASLESLRRYTKFTLTNSADHEIHFAASGRCRFRSHWQYSYVDAEDPESASYYDTEDCAWRLGKGPVRVEATSFYAPVISIELRAGARSISTEYFLLRRNDALVLWQSVGEPYQELYFDFVRLPSGG
jgi:hypothetical protein